MFFDVLKYTRPGLREFGVETRQVIEEELENGMILNDEWLICTVPFNEEAKVFKEGDFIRMIHFSQIDVFETDISHENSNKIELIGVADGIYRYRVIH